MEKLQHTRSYQKAYLEDYDFEAVMVKARQRQILEILQDQKPSTILEIGCGPELLCGQARVRQLPFRQWLIVEPVPDFLKIANALARKEHRLGIIPGFFQDSIAAIEKVCCDAIDFIICSGMLNEVKLPQKFLKTIKMTLKPNGILHVNVPNAGSLHRRLGQAMNLIRHLQDKSKRNQSLRQYHNFDMALLKKTLESSGFSIVRSGGYFLKPFTHQQMAAIKKILTPKVLDGLWELGRQFPQWATEIYVNVKIKK